jgi:hypothetical protein
LRARDKKLRPCDELSTATRRWRPAEARGSRGARARGHQGSGKRSGPGGNDAWEGKPAGGGAIGGGRGEALPAAGEQSRDPRARGGRREGRGPGDLFVISKKFRDLSVN